LPIISGDSVAGPRVTMSLVLRDMVIINGDWKFVIGRKAEDMLRGYQNVWRRRPKGVKRSKSLVFRVPSGALEMIAVAAIMQSECEPRRRPV